MSWSELDKIPSAWDPDRAFDIVNLEGSTTDGDLDMLKLAQKYLERGSALAAQSIVHLAIHSPNERVRLAAAKEVLTRTMGPANDQAAQQTDPLTRLVKAINVDARSN